MKSIPNTLHANLIKFLESLPEHVTGCTVRELELKRKAVMYIKRLNKCKTTKYKNEDYDSKLV